MRNGKLVVYLLIIWAWQMPLIAQSTEFTPFVNIATLSNGKKILQLIDNKDIDSEIKRQKLNQYISADQVQQSPYYAFAYFRILHDIEISRGQPEKAKQAIESMLSIGKELQQTWLEAEAYMWLATFGAKEGNFDEGLNLVEKAIRLSKSVQFHHLTARAYNTKAALYYFQDQYYVALELYLSALEIFMTDPEDPYVSKVLSNISILYLDLEEWDKAWESNYDALQHLEKHGGSNEQYTAFNNNAAFILEQLGRVEESEPYLVNAQKYSELTGNIRIKLNSFLAWARYYISIKQYSRAITFAEQCLDNPKAENYPVIYSDCNRLLAKALHYVGQHKEAIEVLKLSHSLYKEMESQANLADVYALYSLAFEAQGDFQTALIYQRQANIADKALLFDRRAKMIFNLSEQYKDKYREQQLALLEAENALQTAKLAEQGTREKLMFFLIFVGVFLIFILVKKRYWLESHNKSLQDSNDELYKQSHIDSLTGLYNRRYFLDYLTQLTRLSQRQASQACIAIVDIDHFKAVNDTYGHDMGDEVLVQISQVLHANIRDSDLVVRWGGEEFVILLCWPQNYTPIDPEELLVKFERIRLAVCNKPLVMDKLTIPITVSIGISQPLDAKELTLEWHSALEHADKALYQAKGLGRNCVIMAKN